MMGAVKNAFHDEISNRCPECGVGLTEDDTAPCDSPVCPIPDPPIERQSYSDRLLHIRDVLIGEGWDIEWTHEASGDTYSAPDVLEDVASAFRATTKLAAAMTDRAGMAEVALGKITEAYPPDTEAGKLAADYFAYRARQRSK